MKTNNLPHVLQWLNEFPWRGWYFEISCTHTFLRIESDGENYFDSDYENQEAGRGLVALLKERGCDFTGP
ncbi:MAG: hypothetical protein ACRDBP_13335, partial [Luteolibacter sp.]